MGEKEEKRQEFADNNGCDRDTHDVLGQGDKMKCVEKCDAGAGLVRGWNENGHMRTECTDEGFEIVTNAAGDSKCKKVQQEKPKKNDPKKEKPKKDGPKKVGPKKDKPKSDNKGKGKGNGKGKDNVKTGPNKVGDKPGPNKGGDKTGPN